MAIGEKELNRLYEEGTEEEIDAYNDAMMDALFRAEELDEDDIPEVEKIYFDMDGVLADFNGGVIDFCDMEAPSLSGPEDKEKDAEMWRRIKNVDHFYANLDELPGSRCLFETLYKKYRDKCEILSSIPKPERGIEHAKEDKIDWIRRKFSRDIKINIVESKKEKKNFCKGKGCILIDDMEQNILDWKAAGGTGVMHVDPGHTLSRLHDRKVIDHYDYDLY